MFKIFCFPIPVFLCVMLNGVFGQTKPLPPILQKLHEAKGEVITVPQSLVPLIPVEDFPFKDSSTIGQFIVKHKGGLYVCVPGTGRVYELQVEGNQFSWSRLDSTYFSGYNFGALFFHMDSTLYSYGGEGFWNMNGDLRYYNPLSNEWDAIKLSESVPSSFHVGIKKWFYFLDPHKKKLNLLGSSRHPNFVKDQDKRAPQKNKLFELDIVSGDWSEKGAMRDTGFSMWGFLPFGLVVSPGTVVDLEHNRYLNPNISLQRKINSIIFSNPRVKHVDLSFCIDSTLYFGTYSGGLDSLVFLSKELIDTGVPVYTPLQQSSLVSKDTLAAWFLGFFILGAIFIPLIVRKGKPASTGSTDTQGNSLNTSPPPVLHSTRTLELFTAREASLLNFLYTNSVNGVLTTIEEINRFLGVTNKTVEIQKRMRSDLVSSINQKISIVVGNEQFFIDKKRSDVDKRSYDYFIHPEYMELVSTLVLQP